MMMITKERFILIVSDYLDQFLSFSRKNLEEIAEELYEACIQDGYKRG